MPYFGSSSVVELLPQFILQHDSQKYRIRIVGLIFLRTYIHIAKLHYSGRIPAIIFMKFYVIFTECSGDRIILAADCGLHVRQIQICATVTVQQVTG